MLSVLLGCAPPELPEDDEPQPRGSLTAPELWDLGPPSGAEVVLEPLVVASPRAFPGDRWFAAHPGGGPASGIEVGLSGVQDDQPPPVGTVVRLTGRIERAMPPRIRVDPGGLEVLGDGAPPLPWPWDDDPRLELALVEVLDLRVTSDVDPLGMADTSGPVGVGGWFGVSPGFGREGDLTGLLWGGRVSARTRTDWTGELRGDPPIMASIPELRSVPGGTPVVLRDLVPVTPWTRDGRWAVLQDPDGRGVWLDAEAWALPLEPASSTWTGEVRHQPWGPTLRAWTTPEPTGPEREPVVVAAPPAGPLVDATLLTLTATGIAPPDRYGDRATAGPILDDLFRDLADLQDPATLSGVALGVDRFAPLPR